ncbi:methyl-accepting chemotaxis protein [Vibrio mimicus]
MLRSFPIVTRAIIAFSSISLLTLVVGIFSLWQIKSISDVGNDIADRRLTLVSFAGMLQRDFLSRRLRVGSLLDEIDISHYPAIEQDILTLDNQFQQNIEQISPLINVEKGRVLFQAVTAAQQAYLNSYEQFKSMLISGQRAEAVHFRQTILSAHSDALTKTLNEFIGFQTELAQKSQQSAIETQNHAKYMLTFLVVVAFVMSATLGFAFSRSLTQPIGKLLAFSNRIATGDLTELLRDQHSDEPAILLRAMSQMQDNLRSTIQEISQASGLLTSTSEELSVITMQSTSNLRTQSDELSQAATAVTEMATAVDDVARNATETSRASENVNQETRNGKVLLQNTVATIERLMHEVSNSQVGVGKLALRVKEIAAVLEVIRGIADQTNLLALNAAIEAARAGESGRGFAVVADEVRALAHRTQQSTKQIESMIGSIQADTHSTVIAITASAEQASSTLSIAHQTESTFDMISSNIEQITQQNVTIAAAVEELAMVAREVDRNLINIRDISTHASNGARQTSESSGELATLAQKLNLLVLKFNL